MAGLEVLYTCVAGNITCPQDAVVCFVHWELIKNGYRCIGSGDEVSSLSLAKSCVKLSHIMAKIIFSFYIILTPNCGMQIKY